MMKRKERRNSISSGGLSTIYYLTIVFGRPSLAVPTCRPFSDPYGSPIRWHRCPLATSFFDSLESCLIGAIGQTRYFIRCKPWSMPTRDIFCHIGYHRVVARYLAPYGKRYVKSGTSVTSKLILRKMSVTHLKHYRILHRVWVTP